MLRWTAKVGAPGEDAPVTALELFFDLVFVFLITQVTALIVADHSWAGLGRAGLVLIITWWMYDGFAWLSNNISPTATGDRLAMLIAMAGFLTMAISVPGAFGDDAWAFAACYLLVVLIHGAQFSRSSQGSSATAIRAFWPVNLAVPVLLGVAALLGRSWGWVCWLVAALLLLGFLSRRRGTGFALRAGHFGERHGLLIIIALGETVIAIGIGARGHLDQLPVAAAAALAMVLVAGLWWAYFGNGDDERAVRSVLDAPEHRRTTMLNQGFAMDHLLHIAGLVGIAAGLHAVLHEPQQRLPPVAAVSLGVGTGLFLWAQAVFRRVMNGAPGQPLWAGAGVSALLSLLGILTSGLAEVAALTAVVVVVAILSHRNASRRGEILTG